MSVRQVDFDLYLITDRTQTRGRSFEAVVAEAIAAGVKAVQLREKDLSPRQLLPLATTVRKITREKGALLLINDRIDICLSVDADGVHLRTDSLPMGVVRRILGQEKLIGVSTHSLEEARRAQEEGADFIVLGPLYSTPSKISFGPPLGVGVLQEVRRVVSIPIFAVGGVTTLRVKEVLAHGASGIAVISAIMAADDVRKGTYDLLRELGHRLN